MEEEEWRRLSEKVWAEENKWSVGGGEIIALLCHTGYNLCAGGYSNLSRMNISFECVRADWCGCVRAR